MVWAEVAVSEILAVPVKCGSLRVVVVGTILVLLWSLCTKLWSDLVIVLISTIIYPLLLSVVVVVAPVCVVSIVVVIVLAAVGVVAVAGVCVLSL